MTPAYVVPGFGRTSGRIDDLVRLRWDQGVKRDLTQMARRLLVRREGTVLSIDTAIGSSVIGMVLCVSLAVTSNAQTPSDAASDPYIAATTVDDTEHGIQEPDPQQPGAEESDAPQPEPQQDGTQQAGTQQAGTQDPQPQPSTPDSPPEETPIQTWGAIEAGKGFLVGRTDAGELSISAYALVRYLNQMPAGQTFTDHLGRVHEVDPRNDIYSHRIMVFFKGWIGLPKLRYQIALWTVNTTDQKAIFAGLGYQFSRKLSLYAGLNALPGSRSLQGSHPYWLGHDRVMADEYFRPYFTNGAWVSGELTAGLWYNAMVGNNLSALGITARQLDRSMATGASVWWMPTTHEFGPQGAYGDWEYHETLATRFGMSTTRSREDRFTNEIAGQPNNAALRLADSLNVFEFGALAPGATVQFANYRVLAIDAGLKYRGIFLQTELYTRWLDNFDADGPLPVTSIVDKGYYVQAAFYPIPKVLELYGATSQIYGDKSAGFGQSNEYLVGMNYYPANTRNHRLNVQLMDVNLSPVNSTFGYYVGGQNGPTLAVAFSIFF